MFITRRKFDEEISKALIEDQRRRFERERFDMLEKRIAIEMDRREKEARHHARVFQMDMVTIVLGRMGWGEKRFERFDQMMFEVTKEYSEDILSDAKEDKDCWKSKADLDRELAQYVGSRFVPYEERYK